MKRNYLLLLLLIHALMGQATDYSKVDSQSNYVPFQLTTPKEIAQYLTRNLNTDEEKFRAIYYWTAHAIHFDVKQIPGPDYRYIVSGKRNFLKEVLDTHQGVCQHYSMLFDTLCHSVGLQSWFICGYTHYNKEVGPLSHAWNAIRLNGKYYCLDVTWSAGYIEDEKYHAEFRDELFLVDPAKFIKTHVPFDPVWQFSDNPVPNDMILNGIYAAPKSDIKYHYADSIAAISQRDTLSNLILENKRINQVGVTNDLINNYVYFNQQNIVQFRYNAIVANFNKAVLNYNTYIGLKNKQFNKASIPETEITELLSKSRHHLTIADQGVSQLQIINERVAHNSEALTTAIQNLKSELSQEEDFLKRYLSTVKPLRLMLFIK